MVGLLLTQKGLSLTFNKIKTPPTIKMRLNKRQVKLLNQVAKQLTKFSEDCGGWFWFASRLVWNGVMLWLTFKFVKSLLLFSFISQGVPIPPERLEIVGTVIWLIGLIYLVLKIPTFSEVNKNE